MDDFKRHTLDNRFCDCCSVAPTKKQRSRIARARLKAEDRQAGLTAAKKA